MDRQGKWRDVQLSRNLQDRVAELEQEVEDLQPSSTRSPMSSGSTTKCTTTRDEEAEEEEEDEEEA